MGFSCGIVGLPNAGKSTLFNALSASTQAACESYPFCTIEPNVARVPVPDSRLAELARIAGSARIAPTQIEFVDIAGLVRGASRGEGLGNKFLGHIREVDAIVHVVRCFAAGDVAHLEGSVEPLRDAEIVETELMLADLESLERRAEVLTKMARGGDKEAKAELALAGRMLAALGEGKPARSVALGEGEPAACKALHLLSAKPVMYVCNVDEDAAGGGGALSSSVAAKARAEGAACVLVSAAIEAEIAVIDDDETRDAFLDDLGLDAPGLDRVVRAGYGLLGLITFLTANKNEAHAWTVRRGATAIEAAEAVHSDFARGFIRVAVVPYDDYAALGGEPGARDAGKLRLEGRDYVVHDGDVLRFQFSA